MIFLEFSGLIVSCQPLFSIGITCQDFDFRMAKTIIDTVLGLSFDDSPSNLAAAGLFYILTSDVSCFISLAV